MVATAFDDEALITVLLDIDFVQFAEEKSAVVIFGGTLVDVLGKRSS